MPSPMDRYLATQKSSPMDKYLEADTAMTLESLMGGVPQPEPEEGLRSKLEDYASKLNVNIPRIPAEYDPSSVMSQAGLGLTPDQRLAVNLMGGGAELIANLPAFAADLILNPEQLSPVGEGRPQVPPILKEIVRPAAKLAAGLTVKEESKAGRELYEEATKEAFEHPEGPLLPFLIAMGGPRPVGKLARRIKGVKHKVRPVDIVKKVDPIKSPYGDIPAVEVKGKTYVKEAGEWRQPASGEKLPSHLLKDAEAVTEGITEAIPRKDVRAIPIAPEPTEVKGIKLDVPTVEKPDVTLPMPENPYLRMPIERVRKDAAQGVKLAKEALEGRAEKAPIVPEPAVEVPKVKEPWEMTRTEFADKQGTYSLERLERINVGDEGRLSLTDKKGYEWSVYTDANPQLRTNPKTVTIYRAAEVKEFNPGDWVYLRRDMAKRHQVDRPGSKILTKKVPIDDIVKGPDANEFIWSPRSAKELTHREYIQQALSENKPVPAEVLKDYPDLKPKAPSPKVEVPKEDIKVAKAAEVPKEAITSEIDASIQNVMQALKEAKPVRKTQEALYSKERSARLAKVMAIRKKTTGEKGFYAELGQLKGEFPKIEFESIRGKISRADIDNLFKKVVDADILTEWEKITAREGLAKMLGEYGGRVPTRGELTLLEQVFPIEFIETVMAKRPLWTKLGEAGLQLANVPRAIMASFDLSFGLRQGAFAAPKFRKAFWSSWKKQFKIFGSEKAYQASREALVADKDFKFAKQNRISFTEVGKILTQREESFQSQWAEKIPLVGRGVRASGRAYTAFANKYRLDIFKKLVEDAEKLGLKPRENPYLTRKMADFVNNATGRGSLGGFENAAVALNAIFFSPRLNMARMRLLNPVYYIKQPKHLRKQALLTALGAASTATTILTIAKMGGAEVTADPRNANFGKIKIGNTRIDMMAGFGQFIRAAAQITSGQYVSSTTGKTVTLGEGYRALTRMDILIKQIESKEAPVTSFATELLRGKNWAGEDFSIPKEVGRRFVPMVIADMVDIAKDDPSLIPLAVPAVFGIGLQTYSKRKKKALSPWEVMGGVGKRKKQKKGVDFSKYLGAE